MSKLQKYCVYQDRCHQEVRTKLIEYQVYGDKLEQIISELVNEDFLNEERFARSYARGKFRMKKWGKNKILIQLKRRRISDYCIKKGMSEIDEDEYYQALEKIIINKKGSSKKLDYKSKNKIFQYCLTRGYESYLISSIFKELKL